MRNPEAGRVLSRPASFLDCNCLHLPLRGGLHRRYMPSVPGSREGLESGYMRPLLLRRSVAIFWVAVLLWFTSAISANAFVEWNTIGPEGGDARSLTFDPNHPDRIFLGTSSGEIYLSQDAGRNWALLARLGGDEYVLDHIVVDPNDSNVMYVSTWSVLHQQEAGDIFRTLDAGKTWHTLHEMHGKSIRALAMAKSDSHTLVAGTIDGVFRSASHLGGHIDAVDVPADQPEACRQLQVAVGDLRQFGRTGGEGGDLTVP